jgi:hypothetical protein
VDLRFDIDQSGFRGEKEVLLDLKCRAVCVQKNERISCLTPGAFEA